MQLTSSKGEKQHLHVLLHSVAVSGPVRVRFDRDGAAQFQFTREPALSMEVRAGGEGRCTAECLLTVETL